MLKDLKGVVNGKTAVGIILGIVFALPMVITGLPIEVPELVLQIGVGIGTFLALFGLKDAAEQEFIDLKSKLKSFFNSSPFLGFALQAFILFLERVGEFGLPDYAVTISQIISTGLIVFGLKGQAVRARTNNKQIDAKFKQKYAKAQ